MAYTTQFAKATTLAADMSIGETSSATLASSAFTNFSNDFLVLDYDVPSKREVIKCTVTGTAISSITRGQDGTAAIAHTTGAKVAYGFVPAHYKTITDGSGFETGTSSVGIPNTVIRQQAWTAYTPTLAGGGGAAIGDGTVAGRSIVYGRTRFTIINFSFGSTSSLGTSGVTFTIPATTANASVAYLGTAQAFDNNVGAYYSGTAVVQPNASTVTLYDHNNVGPYKSTVPFTWAVNDTIRIFIVTEDA